MNWLKQLIGWAPSTQHHIHHWETVREVTCDHYYWSSDTHPFKTTYTYHQRCTECGDLRKVEM